MNIIESNLNFKSLSYGNNPNRIILHHSEAAKCTIQDIHQWHLNNGWSGCGYHYFVRKDGSICIGRPENAIGSHCPGQNRQSIGICAEGNFMNETMGETQKNAIIELCNYIKNKYGIYEVAGHKNYYSTDCPGTNYPISDIEGGKYIEEGKEPNNATLKQQINALQYWLNVDYSAKIKNDGLLRKELYDNLESVGKIINKGHKSHLVLWLQQKLQIWGYLKNYTKMVYDEATFQAITNLQKNWGRATDGVIGIKTWEIFLNN